MSDREAAGFLGTVPLFADREEADLVELAGMMRRRTLREGEFLWRQEDEPREMVFVVDGTVSASLRVAGGRMVEIGRAGPGDMVGELALLDGGPRTMGAQAAEATTSPACSRASIRGRSA